MLQYLVRALKRLVVLLPGLAVAFVSVNNIYPLLKSETPRVFAFLATYILAAYVLIPAGSRVVRLFFKQKHLPIYSVTPDGFASDPINIGIIGTKKQLIKAMCKAGWEVADKHSPANVFKEVTSSVLGKSYPTAPMSTLYLFGRKQDIGFEIQIENKLGHRHHVRFWATTFDKPGPQTPNDIHWFRRREMATYVNEELLWLGAASKDVGLALIRHNAQLTHMIHPDTNKERDLIVDQLEIDGAKLQSSLKIQKPYTLANRAWSGYLQTDGHLKIVALSPSKPNNRISHKLP